MAAFYVTTGFVVLGVAPILVRQGECTDEARLMLSMTLWLLTVLVPLQIFLGDMQGLNTRNTSPPSWPRSRPLGDRDHPRR